MGRKKKPEEHAHGESWLVSYCDMISLLVTFFLMMMTFSSKHEGDLEQIGIAILDGGGGPFDGTPTLPMGERLDRSEVEQLAEELRQFLEARGSDESGTIKPCGDGFSIAFDVDSSFEAGSAAPRSGATRSATPTTVTNMTPTSAAITFSKTAYRLNQTNARPTSPAPMPQAGSVPPNRAARGSAVDVMAVAPYSRPHTTT